MTSRVTKTRVTKGWVLPTRLKPIAGTKQNHSPFRSRAHTHTHKMGETSFTRELTKQEIAEFREAFEMFDMDGGGMS